jgi:hypothetical protein
VGEQEGGICEASTSEKVGAMVGIFIITQKG